MPTARFGGEAKKGLWSLFAGALFDPIITFRHLKEHPRWLPPILVIALGSSVSMLTMIYVLPDPSTSPLDTGGLVLDPRFFGVLKVLLVICIPVITVLGWLLTSALQYGLAVVFFGSVSFRSALAVLGFAMTPVILRNILLVMLMIIQQQPLSGQGLAGFVLNDTLPFLSTVFRVMDPFSLWNLVLNAFGLSIIFDRPFWKAVIVAIIPFASNALLQSQIRF